MSTNSECRFIEAEPGRWFYALEDSGSPHNAWDWREFARAYGPFDSEKAAGKHLHDHHANPGGSSTMRHGEFRMDEVWTNLIAEAPENTKALSDSGLFTRGFR